MEMPTRQLFLTPTVKSPAGVSESQVQVLPLLLVHCVTLCESYRLFLGLRFLSKIWGPSFPGLRDDITASPGPSCTPVLPNGGGAGPYGSFSLCLPESLTRSGRGRVAAVSGTLRVLRHIPALPGSNRAARGAYSGHDLEVRSPCLGLRGSHTAAENWGKKLRLKDRLVDAKHGGLPPNWLTDLSERPRWGP